MNTELTTVYYPPSAIDVEVLHTTLNTVHYRGEKSARDPDRKPQPWKTR